MFGISGEHLLILAVVLLIFGPRRLPELGHTLGKAIRNFKDSVNGVEEAAFRRLPPKETHKKDTTVVSKTESQAESAAEPPKKES